jgi:hypothetical protein
VSRITERARRCEKMIVDDISAAATKTE